MRDGSASTSFEFVPISSSSSASSGAVLDIRSEINMRVLARLSGSSLLGIDGLSHDSDSSSRRLLLLRLSARSEFLGHRISVSREFPVVVVVVLLSLFFSVVGL